APRLTKPETILSSRNGSLAHVGRANGVDSPVIGLAVRYESTDADDRVVDVLRELVADRLEDFGVGVADEIVSGREPAQVGHSLQVPDDDARLHVGVLAFCLRKMGLQ